MTPNTAAIASAVSTVEINMRRRTLAMTRAALGSGGAPGGAGSPAAAALLSPAGAVSDNCGETASGAPSGADGLAPSHATKSGGTGAACEAGESGGGAGAGSEAGGSGGEAARFASAANGFSIGEDRISCSLAAASSGLVPSGSAG